MYFIGLDYPLDTYFKMLNLVITIVILTLIITPWRKINKIKEITIINEIKLKKLTNFLLIISTLPFITLLLTTIILFIYIDDINTFKYSEGVADAFYYSLPLNIKVIILSTYLYYFSYFLIPLHFYYLSKGNYKLSILCFILSLNIILYGLTYFSRSVFVHYSLIYISFVVILYNTFENKIKKYLKNAMVIAGIIFSIYFIYITNSRFTTDNLYAERIPSESFIQDPVLYSYFDYLSQWYSNSMYELNSYNNRTFNGQITFQPILSLLGKYKIINYDPAKYMALKLQLWPLHWWTFNGFVAYTIYDFGYILTILFSLIYNLIVIRLRPINKKISLLNLFLIVLLIQLPLEAIFYSTTGGIVIPLLLLLPIFLYMKIYILKREKLNNNTFIEIVK